jgi:hypothetical protein
MPETLYDFAREVGVPVGLLSDNAESETSNKVKEWLRQYCVYDWQSEPHQQNQNPAERRIQEVKATTNIVMDRTATPTCLWFLAMAYVVYILNRLSHSELGNRTPIEKGFGVTPDISAALQFEWYEQVYYLDNDESFPHTKEQRGRFVGISEHVGDALTYQILTDDTEQVIHRSVVRSAMDPHTANQRASFPTEDGEGEDVAANEGPITSLADDLPVDSSEVKFPVIDPHDLVGAVVPLEYEGDPYRATVAEHRGLNEDGDHEYLLTIGEGAREQLMTYQDLVRLLNKVYGEEEAEDGENRWTFTDIKHHRRSRTNGWEVLIHWDTGEETWEPLHVIAKDDPITCAKYAKENSLLDQPGWKRFRRLAKTDKRYIRMMRRAAVAKRNGSRGQETK